MWFINYKTIKSIKRDINTFFISLRKKNDFFLILNILILIKKDIKFNIIMKI